MKIKETRCNNLFPINIYTYLSINQNINTVLIGKDDETHDDLHLGVRSRRLRLRDVGCCRLGYVLRTKQSPRNVEFLLV